MNPINIVPFVNPSGATVHRVTGTVNGERRRVNCRTEGEALTLKQNWEREILNLAPLPAITTRLTPDECREAESAYLRLKGKPYSLTTLLDFALANYRPASTTISVRDAVDQFLAAKQSKNLRARSLANLKGRLHQFTTEHGARQLVDIGPTLLEPYLNTTTSPRDRVNRRAVFSNLFHWAQRKGFICVNPLVSIESVKADIAEPSILTVGECRALLRATAAYDKAHPVVPVLPYLVLCLFCAIRPTEVSRLSWDDIDLADGIVTIGAHVSKKRGRRLVAISDNAVAMLTDYAVQKPDLNIPRKRWELVRSLAGYGPTKPWPADVLRHTGISMKLTLTQDENTTASWAGNSPDVIHQHYKGLVKRDQANEFWQLTPDSYEPVLMPENKPLDRKAVS